MSSSTSFSPHFKRIRVLKVEGWRDSQRLMKRLLKTVEPVMKANDLYLGDFFEIDWQSKTQIPGINTKNLFGIFIGRLIGRGKIGICLKNHFQFSKGKYWFDFYDLVCSLLHELTHAILFKKLKNAFAGHGRRFWKEALRVQGQYYEAYTNTHDKLSTFVPDAKAIKRIYKKKIQNDVTEKTGYGSPSARVVGARNDFVMCVRHWAIERKLDAEYAKTVGKKLDHYRSSGRGALLMEVAGKSEGSRYTDTDGYMGMTSHPEHEKFLKGLVEEVAAQPFIMPEQCGCMEHQNKDVEVRGNFVDLDVDKDPDVAQADPSRAGKCVVKCSEEDLDNFINRGNLIDIDWD